MKNEGRNQCQLVPLGFEAVAQLLLTFRGRLEAGAIPKPVEIN